MQYFHLATESKSNGSTSSFHLAVEDSGLWHIVLNNSKDPIIHRLSDEEMLDRIVGGIPLVKLAQKQLARLYEHHLRAPTGEGAHDRYRPQPN
jgi:hypothetical protein